MPREYDMYYRKGSSSNLCMFKPDSSNPYPSRLIIWRGAGNGGIFQRVLMNDGDGPDPNDYTGYKGLKCLVSGITLG